MEGTELVAFNIISQSGDASAHFLKAVEYAESNEFKKAQESIEQGNASLKEAHIVQTTLIQKEINGEKQEINLLLIHAQDHLMNAIVLKNLVSTIVKLYIKVGDL